MDQSLGGTSVITIPIPLPGKLSVRAPGVTAVAATRNGFVASRRISFSEKGFFLTFYSASYEKQSEHSMSSVESLVGTNEKGNAVLWTIRPTFREGTLDSVDYASRAPTPIEFTTNGRWVLELRGSELLVLERDVVRSIINKVAPYDAYAVNRSDGNVAVVRHDKLGSLISIYYANGHHIRSKRLFCPGRTVSLVDPFCSLAFLDKKHVVCMLFVRKPIFSNKSPSQIAGAFWICSILASNGLVTPLWKVDVWPGDNDVENHHQLDVLQNGNICFAGTDSVDILDFQRQLKVKAAKSLRLKKF